MSRKALKLAGLKATIPRLRVLDALEKNSQQHLSAEDLHGLLREADEEVALATVYRVLTQFEDAGLVVRHHFDGAQSVFELDTGAHHDHLLCVECGGITEFTDETIERRQREIAKRAGFEVTGHCLYLYGICARCSAAHH